MVPFRVVLGERDPFAFYGMADYRRRPIVVERHLAKQLPQCLDVMAVDHEFMGAAVVKSAQHKVVTLLAQKLRGDGIYVGEVVVAGIVRGTAYDKGTGMLEVEEIADRFWKLYRERPKQVVTLLGVGLAGHGRP